MESIYWYATPAFLALAVKIWLLVNSDKRRLIIKNWPLVLFFFAISIFNLVEVITYTTSFGPSFYSLFIKLYNGGILLSLCFLLIFSAKIAELKIFTRSKIPHYYAYFCVAFFIVFINTDLFISGYEVAGYGFTRIPGDYFQLSLAFALMNLLLSFIVLTYGYLNKSKNQLSRRRCKAILASYLPFMISLLIFIVLMQIGVKTTAAIVIPFTTTYLLVVLVLTESEKGLFNFLLKTPYTEENKTFKRMTQNLQNVLTETSVGNTVDLKAISGELEKQLISHTLNSNNGSQLNAAKILGVSPSSICRKK